MGPARRLVVRGGRGRDGDRAQQEAQPHTGGTTAQGSANAQGTTAAPPTPAVGNGAGRRRIYQQRPASGRRAVNTATPSNSSAPASMTGNHTNPAWTAVNWQGQRLHDSMGFTNSPSPTTVGPPAGYVYPDPTGTYLQVAAQPYAHNSQQRASCWPGAPANNPSSSAPASALATSSSSAISSAPSSSRSANTSSNSSVRRAASTSVPVKGRRGSGRRDHVLASILFACLKSAPSHSRRLSEIYRYVERNYARIHEPGYSSDWKNTVRHNLSQNRSFEKKPGPGPAKSSPWQLSEEALETGVIPSTAGCRNPNPTKRKPTGKGKKKASTFGRRPFARHSSFASPPPDMSGQMQLPSDFENTFRQSMRQMDEAEQLQRVNRQHQWIEPAPRHQEQSHDTRLHPSQGNGWHNNLATSSRDPTWMDSQPAASIDSMDWLAAAAAQSDFMHPPPTNDPVWPPANNTSFPLPDYNPPWAGNSNAMAASSLAPLPPLSDFWTNTASNEPQWVDPTLSQTWATSTPTLPSLDLDRSPPPAPVAPMTGDGQNPSPLLGTGQFDNSAMTFTPSSSALFEPMAPMTEPSPLPMPSPQDATLFVTPSPPDLFALGGEEQAIAGGYFNPHSFEPVPQQQQHFVDNSQQPQHQQQFSDTSAPQQQYANTTAEQEERGLLADPFMGGEQMDFDKDFLGDFL